MAGIGSPQAKSRPVWFSLDDGITHHCEGLSGQGTLTIEFLLEDAQLYLQVAAASPPIAHKRLIPTAVYEPQVPAVLPSGFTIAEFAKVFFPRLAVQIALSNPGSNDITVWKDLLLPILVADASKCLATFLPVAAPKRALSEEDAASRYPSKMARTEDSSTDHAGAAVAPSDQHLAILFGELIERLQNPAEVLPVTMPPAGELLAGAPAAATAPDTEISSRAPETLTIDTPEYRSAFAPWPTAGQVSTGSAALLGSHSVISTLNTPT